MNLITLNNFIAIKPVQYEKIEARVTSGIATIAQKREVVFSELVMGKWLESGVYASAGSHVVLRGDSGLQAWNKQILILQGKEFVLCPMSEVIGIEYVV